MLFSRNYHASISKYLWLKQSATLPGIIAYYQEIAASCWWLPIFFFLLFFTVVCQRQHQRSRVWLEWLHPGNTLASATVRDLSLFHHFEVLSIHSTDPSTPHSFYSLTHLRMEKGSAEPLLTSQYFFLTTAQPGYFFSRISVGSVQVIRIISANLHL